MLGNAFSGWHLIVIVFLVLLLFGAPKLPGLAKSIGQSMKILKTEVRGTPEDAGAHVVAEPAKPSPGSTA
ncbi:twin-arginine translocase TatA/TatE family subunit [Mycetocola zhadangensis]|uniref:Sec-independent protein translocase protein TatA n=1 Tax=Mycetocola zhadangensis TaxID=1164595 RepID=A0A3L7IXB6_9MICO|nr:twin-arginine translocase TatA/TatE family subunit [Mycetocola zhadangensis]RLQ82830.1 twin-arginine translocase TatA/TatE family subunit [Mycetocola zhadangensis]